MPREIGHHRVHHHMVKMTDAHAAALQDALAAVERAAGLRGEPPDFAALDAGLGAIGADLARLTGRPDPYRSDDPAGGQR